MWEGAVFVRAAHDGKDLRIITFFIGSLLSHQNVIFFSSIFLPVRHLLTVCLHLLKDMKDGSPEPPERWREVTMLVCIAHPYNREGVLLLVLQVLLNVEESVKEDVGQLAPFQVPQSNLTWKGQTIISNQTGRWANTRWNLHKCCYMFLKWLSTGHVNSVFTWLGLLCTSFCGTVQAAAAIWSFQDWQLNKLFKVVV